MDADTFDQLMQRAIQKEIEARDFYRQASERIADSSVKEIFAEMARQEESHRDQLEVLRFDPTARVQFAKVEDFGVAEESDSAPLSFDMSPKEAFQLAMKREQAALEMYQRWADAVEDGEIKRVYQELAEMERSHKARIEDLFVNAAFPEDW
jgi:rubrerythrin